VTSEMNGSITMTRGDVAGGPPGRPGTSVALTLPVGPEEPRDPRDAPRPPNGGRAT
jgi:hypothetical protein